MTRIEQAQQFAHEAHDSIKQVRKYTGQPYWVHTDEVARLVASVGLLNIPMAATSEIEDRANIVEDMVCAAHLHDVLEDVMPLNPLYDDAAIVKKFGSNVAALVVALTDVYTKENFPQLNRAERKRLERERISHTSRDAKTIKLADLISNTKSIVADDPDFARVYLDEKLALLPYLVEGNATLLNEASQLAIAGYKTLGLDLPVVTS